VRFENKIKIVDHIDLNPEKKTQPEPVEAKVEQPKRETQEEITEKVEEPKVTRVEVEETQEEERKVSPEYTLYLEQAILLLIKEILTTI